MLDSTNITNRRSRVVRWPTRDMLQTKNDRCKQKRCDANKKRWLQTKKMRCKQKTIAANKKRSLQTKKMRCKQKTMAANKKDALQTKNDRCKQKRCAANKKCCDYMAGNRSRFSIYQMAGSPVFSINFTNRLIPAKVYIKHFRIA